MGTLVWAVLGIGRVSLGWFKLDWLGRDGRWLRLHRRGACGLRGHRAYRTSALGGLLCGRRWIRGDGLGYGDWGVLPRRGSGLRLALRFKWRLGVPTRCARRRRASG